MTSLLSTSRLSFSIAASFGLALSGAALAAPDTQVEVTHLSSSLGTDGIQRSTAFTERVVRRGNTVWIERVVPHAAQAAHRHEHDGVAPVAKGHKHVDLSAASRWIEKLPDGKLKFKLVSTVDKVIVDVAPAEYGTVGFDGSWLTAYHLMDPRGIQGMTPGAKEGAGRWYEAKSKSKSTGPGGPDTVRLLWDEKLELPLKVSSRNAAGTVTRSTSVRVLGAVTQAPWSAVSAYSVKDYADFLD